MEESEFGKGLVICLVKFAEHKERWHSDKRFNLPESEAVHMHFNGASDHLYEIEVPAKWEGTEIGNKVNILRDRGLEIGHSFRGGDYTEKDVFELYDLAEDIALLIDKELGLEPQIGQW